MRVFQVLCEYDKFNTYVHDTDDWGVVERFEKRLIEVERADPLPIVLFTKYRTPAEKRAKRTRPDVSKISPFWVFSDRAISALGAILRDCGGLGPTEGAGDWTAFVPTLELDVLDEERSELERFPSSNRIMEIVRPVLKRVPLRDVGVFKLYDVAVYLFATDKFRDAYNLAQLTGLKFEECELSD